MFYALRDTRTPVKYAVYVILAKIAVNLALIRQIGFVGLALGTSLASLLNILLLLGALQKRIGAVFDRGLYSTLIRITLASIIMGAGAWALHLWLSTLNPAPHLLQRALNLGVSMAGALVILLVASHLLKIEQAGDMVRFARRRLKI